MEYIVEVLTICATVWLLALYYFRRAYSYWKSRNVVYIQPSIPFGSVGVPLFDKIGISERLRAAYKEIKMQGAKYGGFYIGVKPCLLATSPEMVKTILHSAFEHFEGHGNAIDEKNEPLSAHLLNLEGQRWKSMRVKLTPTFTSGKMKMMFQTLLDCGDQLEDYIETCCKGKEAVDIRETLARFTTDVIGSCAFGLECNSFKNSESQFRKHSRNVFQLGPRVLFRRFCAVTCPALLKVLKLPMFDRESTDFFMNVVKKLVDYRKKNNVTRNDFVQILLNMKENGFTVEEIAAQAFVFFLAGFETSSTTMTFCLYELTHHIDIQDKVREEMNSVVKAHGGKITYEGIMEMKYLDQVIHETLRKHPPVPVMKRLCNKDYQLPNGAIMQKGNSAFLSILGLHRDEDIYPEPDKFDPERFSEENRSQIPPYAFIPFGEGPRICIGLRFGLLQTKVGLCLLLRNYKVTPHESLKYPIDYDAKSLILNTKGVVMLNFEKC